MNESTVRATADALVTKDLARRGFKYVNLDDCYIKNRLPNGTLVPDPRTFPSGMRSLGDYIHNVSICPNKTVHNMSICNYSASADMMFGVYTDRGPMTCAGRPAAQGFEAIDAATYANWTVDYLKEDSVRFLPSACAQPRCSRPSRIAAKPMPTLGRGQNRPARLLISSRASR